MKNRIFDESIISVCQIAQGLQNKTIGQSLQTIIRFGLIVFLFKSLNVFNLSAATKNLITNYTFFVNSFMPEVIIR